MMSVSMPNTTQTGPTHEWECSSPALDLKRPNWRPSHVTYTSAYKIYKTPESSVYRWANSNSHAAMQNPFLPLPHGKKWICSICLQWLLLLSSITIILFCKSYSWHASNHLSILSWVSLGLFGKCMSLPVSGIFFSRVHAPFKGMLLWLLGVPK